MSAELQMTPYIGTKQINAVPMNRQAYNDLRGWKLPDDEDGSDEGYLVEYVDGGQANTDQFNGYVSWSPCSVFEQAYHASGEMNFGGALELLKRGYKMARKGWNDKGMWVALGGQPVELDADKFWNAHNREFAESNGGKATVQPYLTMKNAQGEIQMGWAPTQPDLLSDDWEIAQ